MYIICTYSHAITYSKKRGLDFQGERGMVYWKAWRKEKGKGEML